jgi:hypothetical protein
MIEADLDRLLHNWTMWKSGAGRGGMGYAASSYDLEGRGSRAGVTMPVIVKSVRLRPRFSLKTAVTPVVRSMARAIENRVSF